VDINERTYGKIRHILPVLRGRVTVQNIIFINALLYICENGCKWRRLPKECGNYLKATDLENLLSEWQHYYNWFRPHRFPLGQKSRRAPS